jgi:trk system potassium uptake protein TrkA
MNFIVVGCGRLGAELAYRLYQRSHQVVVVDQTIASFNNLHPDFAGRTVEGEALNQDVLHRAGIKTAEGLAAVTNSDTMNVVVAHIARSAYNLTNIVSRNYDPRWRALHEAFNLQVVSSTSWGAQRIEELLYTTYGHTVFSAGNGEVEIYEFEVPPPWEGLQLGQLITGVEGTLVALTRAGRAYIPLPETRLLVGDVINISATLEGIEEVRSRLHKVLGG